MGEARTVQTETSMICRGFPLNSQPICGQGKKKKKKQKHNTGKKPAEQFSELFRARPAPTAKRVEKPSNT